jgi:hypothetical protein
MLYTREIQVNVYELFFQENKPEFNRYDEIVRYLAIENYYNKNNFGFELYRKMQNARIGQGSDNEYVENFKVLIKSFDKKGYNDNSKIELDKYLSLVDGSHRMALAFYHKINIISCYIRPVYIPIEYTIEWFIENDFSIDEINIIKNKYREIYDSVISPFICILWPPVQKYFDEITNKIALLEKIIDYRDYHYDDSEFERIIKRVYASDDIEAWKVELKLKKIRVISLHIETPQFRLKSNNNTLSIRGEQIKRIIRNAYKSKVENYYFDIIIHIGDNYYQNNYIRKLFYTDC